MNSYDSKEKVYDVKTNDAWVDIISGLSDEDLVTDTGIDKLINDHKKAIKEHRAEIKRSQRSIENLEYKKKKLKYGDDTVIYEIADLLHDKCTLAHDANIVTQSKNITYCDYYFYSLDIFHRKHLGDARQMYYDKAKRVIDVANELKVSLRKAVKIINEV